MNDDNKIEPNEYYATDLTDPDRVVVRPRSKKKHDKFEYCKWAAGDWEARFYIGTPTHRDQCDDHIKQIVNNPCWFTYRARKVDKRAAVAGSKDKNQGKKNQKWIT